MKFEASGTLFIASLSNASVGNLHTIKEQTFCGNPYAGSNHNP